MSNAGSRPVAPPRSFGAINGLGLWTLYKKEVRRFLKVVTQTVLAPVAQPLATAGIVLPYASLSPSDRPPRLQLAPSLASVG